MLTPMRGFRITSAFFAGLVVSFSLPPYSQGWPLLGVAGAIAGMAWLYHGLRRASGFPTGFLFGIGLFLPQYYWLVNVYFWAPFAVIPLYASFYGVAFLADTSTPWRFASLFTAAEFVRSIGSLAFPFALLGMSSASTPLERLLPFVGVWGVCWLIAALGAELVRPTRRVIVPVLALFAALMVTPPPCGKATLPVGVVQGSFPDDADYEYHPEEVFAFLAGRTRLLAGMGARLVVWSETVILESLNQDSPRRLAIQRLADESGATIVCGAPTSLALGIQRNSAYVFAPGALRPARYDKYHLVPFGEYVPLYGPDYAHHFIPQGQGDFSPAPFPLALGELGILTCYEGAFPYLARAMTGQGARVLVNISNDAWEKNTGEAEHHYVLARLRAIECGRPFIRAGNVGVSAVVAPDGRVLARQDAWRAGHILASVPLGAGVTPALLFGDWVAWCSLLGSGLLLTAGALENEYRRVHD